ncbi:MAG: hypothetical protein ABIA62_01255 [Candidatus Woesearchaeota archaeon]
MAKSKVMSIKLKKRSRISKRRKNIYVSRSSWRNKLNHTISVGSLLKYTGITLAFIIIVMSIFMLGRLSALPDAPEQEGDSKISSKSTNVETLQDQEKSEKETTVEDQAEKNAKEEPINEEETAETEDTAEEDTISDADEENDDPAPACKYKDAPFDYTYTGVSTEISNFQKELRGDNWASITSMKLTITNNEKCTIINPTKLKIKLNARGKGSVWWDDELFLSDTFRDIKPGETVTDIVPVHVSYSDIYSEKDLRVSVFDEYDVHIVTYKEYITIT